jgi:mRNA-degrading endonuclease RelE of RelBE toxin-antitoxin system
VGVALCGPLADCRSLKRGSYRIVYKVMPGKVGVLRVYQEA